MRFSTGYMDEALFSLPEVIEKTHRALADVEVDTFVGTGFSGGVVVPALAMAMDKKFVLIRKDDDDSHHNGRVLGELEGKWMFVDDMICSGRTKRRVFDRLREERAERAGWTGYSEEVEYIGDYLYRYEVGLRLVADGWFANESWTI